MDFTPRRVVLFLLISSLVLISWNFFVLGPYKEAQRKAAEEKLLAEDQAPEKTGDKTAAKTDQPDKKTSPEKGDVDSPAKAEKPPGETKDDPDKVAETPPKKTPAEEKLAEYPKKEAVLGSLDPESGYFFQATLTTKGAAVSSLKLNDPRYRDLDNTDEPLSLLDTVAKPNDAEGPGGEYFRTFATSFPEMDQLLKRHGVHLDTVNWKIVESDPNKVTFEYEIPGAYRVTKEFKIHPSEEATDEQRDTETQGYFLSLDIKIKNLQGEAGEVTYLLQGPVGMPLEDAESTSKFRDIKIGTINDKGEISHQTLTVKDLAETIEDEEVVEHWATAYRYVGVDGQFFATLLYNSPEQSPTTEQLADYYPQVLNLNKNEPTHSEVSVLLKSRTLEVKPGETVTHSYTLYAGPKRQVLLSNIDAEATIEFGWFGWISKGLLAILAFLHNTLFLPYGLAIVCLTILVRGALFPLSKKQAHSAARMKELQPRLQELKKKYGDDKQKFAEAQMKLFRESGYNPFAGCLPMILQLPIFIGLYGAIRHAIDLRAATFLWVDNLAAPDHLFPLPFRLPWVGNYFNLLPILTVGLFLAQQKMFMPTPDPDDEQAVMQHKMMNFMMIFMGFLFYHMPAGLCIYFIASSLWGMGERKILDYGKKDTTGDGTPSTTANVSKPGGPNGREKRNTSSSKKQGKKSSKSRR